MSHQVFVVGGALLDLDDAEGFAVGEDPDGDLAGISWRKAHDVGFKLDRY